MTVLKLHYQYIHLSLICREEERNENKNQIIRQSIDNYIRNARGLLPNELSALNVVEIDLVIHLTDGTVLRW